MYGREVDSLTVRNGDVNLLVIVDGEGPTLLLLHGWPDTSALWDEVAPNLVEAGFRVAVPDLRGCGRSDKPTRRRAVSDAPFGWRRRRRSSTRSVGKSSRSSATTGERHLPGSWRRFARRPGRTTRVVLSVGHPTALRTARAHPTVKSWYMLLFQFEGVGEAFLRKNDYEALRRWSGHPRADAVIEELERDGQMTTHLALVSSERGAQRLRGRLRRRCRQLRCRCSVSGRAATSPSQNDQMTELWRLLRQRVCATCASRDRPLDPDRSAARL